MKPFPRAEISRCALQSNLAQLRLIAPKSKIMAVVKANGYGHGLLNVAESVGILNYVQSVGKYHGGADGFGLARLEEALQLREGGVKGKLLLLEGFFRQSDLATLVTHNIDTVVHHESQLHMLETIKLDKPVTVWIKIDTGMHRIGFTLDQFEKVYQRLLHCPQVAKPIHLMTHFACADEPDNQMTQDQMNAFLQLIDGLDGDRTLANSAGTLFWPTSQADWIRPGIALYGISPVVGDRGVNHRLIPAMELVSNLIAVRDHKAGDSVGYGAFWTAKQDTRLGVVAIGYGDGYPRNAPEGTPVWINGRRVPIVGRVSMDMLTVDLGADAQDNVGDSVQLWGKALAVEEVAEHIGTIAYELVTKLTPRVVVELLD
ncbi:alanine racemase [Shewanella inventionis]|uniref:Alanine racemase n=1 Tax=Shewanella inventionis TaxID=1738770 RepID=A0ABQ1ING3_9GAMM|nr:alanine racemase [Shewanella inventionis]MCL1156624.1 alanine racemase [Shewanella inventionis]UAL44316.1 alanine racemase [Shewanella inventionis]GGB46891.1 alanine racemase [Shewanella inventionis]